MQENERKEQQAQDISEEMISQENISQEIGEKEPAEDTQEQGLLNITFIPKYMDIFDGLCATDQADGTGKRARMLFVVLDHHESKDTTADQGFPGGCRCHRADVCTAAGRCRTVY